MRAEDALADVAAALRSGLPPGAALSLWEGGEDSPLLGEEAAAVRRAVESRRVEFARGRHCARQALAQVGGPWQPIPMGTHREPLWPIGFVGSISHCAGLVAAVVARSTDVGAIGLDAEVASPLPEDVRARTVHPDELPTADRCLDTVVFSAKEAVHKAIFPESRTVLDFLDVVIEIDARRTTFSVRSAPAAGTPVLDLARLHGWYSVTGGFVLTLCHAPAR